MFAEFTPPTPALTCQTIDTVATGLIARLTSTVTGAPCPLCGRISTRIHSRYQRRLTDLPLAGQAFVWHVNCHKFFCDNQACDRRIFTERFDQQICPHARWIVRCQENCGTWAYSQEEKRVVP